jgi:hypothetical protein
MTKNHNPEMHKYLIEQYTALAFTHTYAFCVKHKGKMKVAIVENANSILPDITYCEPNSSSHGKVYGLRMMEKQIVSEMILNRASEIFELGTYKDFENGFTEYRQTAKGNRGDYFEMVFTKMVNGTNPDKRNACFTDCGDVIANGKHYQCKLYNATFTTESTIARLLGA